LILGLTGGYCSGKNAAAAMLAVRGWLCIDVDALGHLALEETAEAVVELLGPGVVADPSPGALAAPVGSDSPCAEGQAAVSRIRLDRKKIGAAVFADPALLKRYESIVHPAMLRLLDEAIDAAGPQPAARVCINAAILYRLPQLARCDAVAEIRASLVTRLIRGRLRDGLSAGLVLDRIRRQRPLWKAGESYRGERIVIRNDGGLAVLERRVDRLNRALSG
jgi:dephospho-CoA kinase